MGTTQKCRNNPPAILLVGSSQTCPDLEYATGFRVTDPVVALARGAERYLIVPQLEYGRAARLPGLTKVYTPDLLGLPVGKPRRMSDWILALLKTLGIRRVVVAPTFPYGIATRLQKARIPVALATGELFPERLVKQLPEIRHIRDAQQAAVIAMRSAASLIAATDIDRDGYLRSRGRVLTSEAVIRHITGVLLNHDCTCREVIVAGGFQAADPHERGHGPLRAGEAIVIDIFPQHDRHGYWGDLTRTVVRGKPSPLLRRMYQAVRAAQTEALSHVRAGARCATVHRAAVAEFARRKFATTHDGDRHAGFIHATGHGVGLSIHESPSVSLNDTRLKAGHVITIEPGLYYPGIGGIRIEDTIVVTSTGWRYLVPCEKRFEL